VKWRLVQEPSFHKIFTKSFYIIFLSYNSLLQDDSVPDDSVPDDSVPDDSVPDDSVPDDSVPHEVQSMTYTKVHPKEQNLHFECMTPNSVLREINSYAKWWLKTHVVRIRLCGCRD